MSLKNWFKSASRYSRIIFSLLFFLTVFSWTATPINTGDVFMYMSLGRFIHEYGTLPVQDPYLYLSSLNVSHFHHEWLSYLFFYEAYKVLGFAGLIFGKMFLILLLFSIPVFVAQKFYRFDFRTLGLLVLCIVAIAARVGERAYLFSDICTTFVVGLLLVFEERKKLTYIYILPFIFLFWVQLHPGFPLGLFFISGFAILRWFDMTKMQRKHFLIAVMLSYGACFINPLGMNGFVYPFKIFFSSEWEIYRQINSEWMPLMDASVISIVSKGSLLVLFIFSFVASLLQLLRTNLFPMTVTLIMAYLSWSSMRFISVSPLVFTLMLIAYSPFSVSWRHKDHLRIKANVMMGVVAAFGVISLTVYVAQFKGQGIYFLFGDESKTSKYPINAISVLRRLPQGTVFAEWDWNSVICWFVDGHQKVVVHGHIDKPEFAVKNFLAITQSQEEFQQIVRKNDIHYFLLSPETVKNPNSVLGRMLLGAPWQVVYQDQQAILFAINEKQSF